MKLRDVVKGSRAVKPVRFRLANAPLLAPGQEADEHTIIVGVRVLTPGEVGQVFENAIRDAAEQGVTQWLDTHPLCRLHEMQHAMLLACVDYDSGDRAEPFFASLDEIRNHPGMGADNLAYLFAQWQLWQDEVADNIRKTPGELVAMVLEEAGRPENATDGPFSDCSPSMLKACLRSICVLYVSSLATRSPSTSPESSSSKSNSQPNEPSQDPSPEHTPKKTKRARRP